MKILDKITGKKKPEKKEVIPVEQKKSKKFVLDMNNITPGALIAVGIQNGNLDIEQIKELKALWDAEKEKQAEKAFFKALVNFQYECPEIEKKTEVYDKYGKLRYRYAKIEQIIKQIKEPLKNNNLAYRFTYQPVKEKEVIVIKEKNTEIEKFYIITTCHITHIDGHTEDTPVKMPIDKSLYMSEMQKVGTAQKYGDRYSLSGALGIVTQDEDIDGNNSMQDLMASKEKVEDAKIIKENLSEIEKDIEAIMFNDLFREEEKNKFKQWLLKNTDIKVRKAKINFIKTELKKRENKINIEFDKIKNVSKTELKSDIEYKGAY